MADDDVLWRYLNRDAGLCVDVEPGSEGRLSITIETDDGWTGADLPPEAVSTLVGALRVWLLEHPASL